MIDFEHPVTMAVIVAIPSFLLGYLGYRRAVKVDKVAEQSGAASTQLGAVGQVIDGLNGLVVSLQEDNKSLRLALGELRVEVKALEAELARLSKEREAQSHATSNRD